VPEVQGVVLPQKGLLCLRILLLVGLHLLLGSLLLVIHLEILLPPEVLYLLVDQRVAVGRPRDCPL
jgi:hypothetical protein